MKPETPMDILLSDLREKDQRICELEATLKLIATGGKHDSGMQFREHDLTQVRVIAAAALAGDIGTAEEKTDEC